MSTVVQKQPEQNEPRQIEKVFRPSGWLLEAETALARAIEMFAVSRTPYNPTTLDLLVRLSLAPEQQLRGIDLCRQLLKSPGYVSRVIDRAEGDGLVVRQPDPDDRRAQRITLTESGEDVLDAVIPHVVKVLDETVYTALDDNEVEILIDLLTRITASAHQLLESDGGISE